MPQAKSKPASAINLLFIGNSFTQRNNVPGLLAELAAARGVSVTHDLVSAGGASLRRHWNDGQAAARAEQAAHITLVRIGESFSWDSRDYFTLRRSGNLGQARNLSLFVRQRGTELGHGPHNRAPNAQGSRGPPNPPT